MTVTIEPVELAADEVKALAASGSGEIAVAYEDGGLLRRHPPRLSIHGCDLLSDDADWDAETWAMTVDGASHLASAMRSILGGCRNGATVEALWDGEVASRDQDVSADGFIALAEASRLESRTRYLVSGQASR